MASSKIKGITIEIGGDTSKLGKAIEDTEKQSRSLQGELKQIDKLLKFDPTNMDLLVQKQNVLADAVSSTSAKLEILKEAEKQVIEQFERGEVGEDQLRSLQREIIATENNLGSFKSQLQELTESFYQSSSATEKTSHKFDDLKNTISEQEKELANLKNAYSNVVIEQGAESEEAQRLSGEIQVLNSKLTENRTTLKEVETQADSLTQTFEEVDNSTEEVGNTFEELKKTISKQESELTELRDAYANVILEQGEESEEAQQLSSRISSLNDDLKANRSTMADAEKQADELADALQNAGDNAEESEGGFTIMKGALAELTANTISSAIGGIKDFIGSLFELDEATQEFRTMMAKLSGSTQTFGYDTGKTMEQYEEFNKYLMDDQASVNCVTNLLGMKASMETVKDVANASIAVWSAYGDSIPIEGLTESINESSQVAQVTGNLADALNWATMSRDNWNKVLGEGTKRQQAFFKAIKDGQTVEDAFNEALLRTNTTQERAQLIADTLNTIYGESKTTYDIMNASTLEANEAQQDLLETQSVLGESVQPLNTAMTELKTQALDLVTPIIQELSWRMQDLLVYLKENPEVLNAIIPLVTGLATAFGVLATALAIQALINGVTKAMQALNIAIKANGFIGLASIIAGVVVAITTFLMTNEDARKKLAEIWKKIEETVSNVVDAIVEFFTVTIPQAWEDFKKSCSNLVKSVVNYFKKLGSDIKTNVDNVITNIITWGKNLYTTATTAVKNTISAIVKFFTQLPSKIWNAIVGAVSQVTTWGSQLLQSARSVISTLVSTVFNLAKQIPQKIWNAIVGAVSNVVKWGSQLVSKATSAVKNVSSAVVNGLKSIPSKISSIGGNIVTGLWNGINNKVGWVLDKIKGFGSSILNGLKKVFDIHSPSRVMRDQIGKNIALGVGEGIQRNVQAVVAEAEKLGKKTTEAVKKSTKTSTTSSKSSKSSASKKSTAEQKRAEQYKKDTSNLALQIEKENASISKQIKLWDNLRKKYKEGTTERKNADTKYYALLNKQEDESYKKLVSNIDTKIKKNNLSYAKQADLWLKARNQYRKGTDEYKALDLKYSTAKNKISAEQYKKDVERIELKVEKQELGAQQELALYKKIQTNYKKGTDERIKLDKTIAKLEKEARKERFEEDKDAIDLKVEQEELGAQEQLKLWKALRKEYKKGTDERKEIDKEIAKLTNDARKEKFDNLKADLQKEKDYDRLSLAQEVEYWNKIRKQFKKGTEEREEAELEYYNVKKELTEKIADLETDYNEKVQSANEELIQSIQDVTDAYNDSVQSRADAIVSSMNLFDLFEISTDNTGEDLLNNLQSQVDGLTTWREELAKLEAKGIDGALLDELQGMGASATGELQALNGLTDEELDKYVALWQQKNEIAKQQATHELEDLKAETAQKIQQLTFETAQKLEEYKATYVTSMQELGIALDTQVSQTVQTLTNTTDKAQSDLLTSMTKSGQKAVTNFSSKFVETAKSKKVKTQIETLNTTVVNTIKPLINQMVTIGNQIALGVAEGIQQKINVVRKTIEELIRLTVQQAKLSAGIHSPSRVMRDEIGKNLALGVAEGITDNSKSVTTAMTDTLDKLTNLDFNPVTFGRKLNNTFSVATNSSPIMELLDLVSYYFPRLIEASKHSIMLDSGVLVGETIGDIDNQLSQIYSLRARGV